MDHTYHKDASHFPASFSGQLNFNGTRLMKPTKQPYVIDYQEYEHEWISRQAQKRSWSMTYTFATNALPEAQ